MWQPEIGPMAYIIASKDRPKASETPRKPILSPARTALPQLANTSTKVPTSSAKYLFILSSASSCLGGLLETFSHLWQRARQNPINVEVSNNATRHRIHCVNQGRGRVLYFRCLSGLG